MKRVLVPAATLGRTTLDAGPAHHLVHVLRVAQGDALEVFDGAGRSFDAVVEAVHADGTATLTLSNERQSAPERRVTVIQGLPKAEKLELVVQKATELGAWALIAAACERSVVKLEGKEAAKQARWQKIADEAARQCGRADVPAVSVAASLEAAVAALGLGTQVLVLDEEERARPLSHALAEGPVALIVGPEGGLSRAEVAALTAKGAQPVTLGRLVLRTETAALAALAVIRHLDGLLG
jgi:16S rRNA (uracil1498-N3)-methyltransferase